MRPASTMKVVREEGHTVGELESMLHETNCNGFPVVNDADGDMLIVGFVTRFAFNFSLYWFLVLGFYR